MVFSIMLLATVPLMAQDKSLEEKLEETKAAIEDQQWVIKQLEKNFFKVVAELNEELDFLRALTGKQLEEIDSYLKEIASLKLASIEKALELVQLESITAEQAKKVGELEVIKEEQAKELAQVEAELAQVEEELVQAEAELVRLESITAEQASKLAQVEAELAQAEAELVRLESITAEQASKLAQLEVIKEEQTERIEGINTLFGKAIDRMKAEIDSLNIKNAELEAIKEEQAERIERINTLFGKAIDRMKAEIDSLNTKNAELVAAKDLLQTRLDVIDEKYTQVVKDYKEQLLAIERLKDAHWKAQVKTQLANQLANQLMLAQKDREIAFYEEGTAKLDKEIALLMAEAAELEAANARLKRHRLLLGLGFIAAAYCAVS